MRFCPSGLRSLALASAVLSVAPAFCPAAPPAPFDFRTVALSDQQAPGTAPGVVYKGLADTFPAITSAGDVSFSAIPLAGPGVDNTNAQAQFVGRPGAVRLFARTGSQAPDTSAGTVFGNFTTDLFTNSTGTGAVEAQLSGPDVDFSRNGAAIFTGVPDGLRLLARVGDAAAGAGGATYASLQSSLRGVNNTGQVVFQANLTGPGTVIHGNDTGVWLGTPGNVRLVAREGEPAPDVGGVQFGQLYLSLTVPSVNNAGQVAFASLLKTSPGSNIAIFSGPPDALHLVARTGSPAPDAPGGEVFTDLRLSAGDFNDAGQVAFLGRAGTHSGIWAGSPGALQLVALGGQHAPGTPAGVNYDDQGGIGFPRLSDSGTVAFGSNIQGGGQGVWAGLPGALHLLARSNQPVPGAPDGVLFSSPSAGPDINSSGQVVFSSTLTGPAVSQSNNEAIFFADPDGDVTMALRTGDLLDVGGGDLRTIQDLGLSLAGLVHSLNDAGQFTFRATFTDGSSGVFVTVVPVPAGMGVLLVGLAPWARRRTSRRR